MVVCLIALVVFGILGIFSAKYRQLAKEAFTCVIKRLTLQPCPANLNNRLRLRAVFKLAKFNPNLAKFVGKHFEAISWILTILLIISLAFTVRGGYNLVKYGSCDPHSTDCIFAPGNLSCGSEECAEQGCDCEQVGCEDPEFEACEGVCDCQETVCG